ncbi:hypothetical protein PAMP_007215 [Pampus punctatissimus]
MAQQEEPLYDFPEPIQPSERKFLGHQRGRGSLRSVSVLDRLLLTIPVWLQLSINPATALHILQREPPGKSSAAQPDSAPQSDSDNQLKVAPESDNASNQSGRDHALFHEFCPITTRSPRELDCGSGLGALCFINPLFLQSQTVLSRRRMFKRSVKVRVSTETSTLLSPPLSPPPPPPLMPKTKGKCKAQKQVQGTAQPSKGPGNLQDENPNQVCQIDPTSLTQTQENRSEAEVQYLSAAFNFQPVMREQEQTQMEAVQEQARVEGEEAPLPLVMEHLPEDSDYMQPSQMINLSNSSSLSPYLSSDSPMAPPLFPKLSPSLSPHDSSEASPSLSPYQSPSLSPKLPFSLSPCNSPNASPSLSPYQSPSPSPKVPFSLSPFTSVSFSPLAEAAYHTPATPSRPDQQRSEGEAEEGAGEDEDDETEELHKEREEEETGLVLQINAASLNDSDSCSSFSSLEEAAETPPHSPHQQDNSKGL